LADGWASSLRDGVASKVAKVAKIASFFRLSPYLLDLTEPTALECLAPKAWEMPCATGIVLNPVAARKTGCTL
jgi:hypothetical protein